MIPLVVGKKFLTTKLQSQSKHMCLPRRLKLKLAKSTQNEQAIDCLFSVFHIIGTTGGDDNLVAIFPKDDVAPVTSVIRPDRAQVLWYSPMELLEAALKPSL